jgi:hypothetical protein
VKNNNRVLRFYFIACERYVETELPSQKPKSKKVSDGCSIAQLANIQCLPNCLARDILGVRVYYLGFE